MKLTRLNNSLLLTNANGNICLRFDSFRAYNKATMEMKSFESLKAAIAWLA